MVDDKDITIGFIGENGIDIYKIEVVPSKEVSNHIIETVIFYSLTGIGTFKPIKIIKDIDSAFLFVTTHSGSDYVLNVTSGTLEVGTIGGLDNNKRLYFKTEQADNIKVLKLFVPI